MSDIHNTKFLSACDEIFSFRVIHIRSNLKKKGVNNFFLFHVN